MSEGETTFWPELGDSNDTASGVAVAIAAYQCGQRNTAVEYLESVVRHLEKVSLRDPVAARWLIRVRGLLAEYRVERR